MSATSTRPESLALPESGFYPVPDHKGKVVDRQWDGEVWTDEVHSAGEAASLPAYKKHFFFLLRAGNWKLFLIYLITAFVAVMFWDSDREAKWVSGVQILMVPFAGVTTFIAMYAVVWRVIGRRVGFNRIPVETMKSILKWGLLSAIVGFAFAIAIELLVPRLFGGNPKADAWSVLAGPAEETGKLLIPVLLWIKGRYRLPREGYLLVLMSASIFGVMEGIEYALRPETWQPSRPFFEVMHPLFTGFVAAVAWQAAWHRDKIFTKLALGAWAVAMIAHSTNDVVALDKNLDGALLQLTSSITIVTVIVMYLLQKHVARQMVPPDNVGKVSPHWRPVAPKNARVTEA